MPAPNEKSSTGSDDENATDQAELTSREASDGSDEPLPRPVIDDAERLTRLERNAVDDEEAAAYEAELETLLEDHEYTARIRTEDDDVLVLHPQEWHDEGTGVIRTDQIDDLERAVEIPLEGTGDPDDWDAVDEHNRDLAARVREAHGDVHGDNAEVLADFVSNHYAKPIESVTGPELTEFRTDYYVRNAWPSKKQRAVVDDSIELVYKTADESVPEYRSE